MDFYDENWVLDQVECTGDLNVDFIFKYMVRHIKELEEKLENVENYGRDIKGYDIEKLKLFKSNFYN